MTSKTTDRKCPDEICLDRMCPGGERPNGKQTELNPAHMLPLAICGKCIEICPYTPRYIVKPWQDKI